MASSSVILLALVSCAGFFSVDGFCSRPYDSPDWQGKSLAERAEAVDIVVYGNVTVSPCTKPIPSAAPSTVQPTTSASNSTADNSTADNSTAAPNITTPAPTTHAPTVGTNNSSQNISSSSNPYNCSTGYYNITVKVFCVIKGGHLPEILELEKFGLGDEMCVHENETVDQFHAYEGQNYVFFLGRHEEPQNGSSGFWLHTVNEEPAATEILHEDNLEAIFEAAGKHAHAPLGVWANKTHSICEPYTESGAGPGPISAHVAIWLSLATLVSMVADSLVLM